jgi:hypothetical protein
MDSCLRRNLTAINRAREAWLQPIGNNVNVTLNSVDLVTEFCHYVSHLVIAQNAWNMLGCRQWHSSWPLHKPCITSSCCCLSLLIEFSIIFKIVISILASLSVTGSTHMQLPTSTEIWNYPLRMEMI